MRRWIVEETGEVRIPTEGEWCIFEHAIHLCKGLLTSSKPILQVTEIVPGGHIYIPKNRFVFNHPLSDRFDEWNW
jgi:hypothetical protein